MNIKFFELLSNFKNRLGKTNKKDLKKKAIQMEIEYSMEGQSATRFLLSIRSKENIYRVTVDESDFSSVHVDLEDLEKILNREPLGISGLTPSVEFVEIFTQQILQVNIELCYQKSERTKRSLESFTIELPQIDRDIQLEEITKLKNENSALRRENERIVKKLKTMETFGFFPYYNKDIITILSVKKLVINAVYESSPYQCIEYDNTLNFVTYLTSHPRFKEYISWVKINHPTQVGHTNASMVFRDPFDKIEKKKFGQHMINKSITAVQGYYYLEDMHKFASPDEKIILNRWFSFVCTLFDLVNEYNFKGIQLLPNGQCMPHKNPEHVNEFFTEKYFRNPPTVEDKLFFDENIGFYKCTLYDF